MMPYPHVAYGKSRRGRKTGSPFRRVYNMTKTALMSSLERNGIYAKAIPVGPSSTEQTFALLQYEKHSYNPDILPLPRKSHMDRQRTRAISPLAFSREASPATSWTIATELNTLERALADPASTTVKFMPALSLATSRINGLQELYQLCPLTYRTKVQRYIMSMGTKIGQLVKAIEAKAKLENYLSKDEVPRILSAWQKPPHYTLTSAASTQAEMDAELKALCQENSVALLKVLVGHRDTEVTRLKTELAYATYSKELELLVDESYKEVCVFHGVSPAETPLDLAAAKLITGEPGAQIAREYSVFRAQVPVIGKRAAELSLAASQRRTSIWVKKVELLRDATQKMEIDPPLLDAKSLQKTIDDRIKKLVLYTSNSDAYQLERIEERRLEKEGRPGKRRKTGSQSQDSYADSKGGEVWYTSFDPAEEETIGLGVYTGYPSTKQEVEVMSMKWEWNKPTTYPDSILELPLVDQMKCIMAKMPVDILMSFHTRAFVHHLPDMNVPLEVSVMITSGSKYLLNIQKDESLPLRAWTNFSNSIRWQYKFKNERDEPFDQDYWTAKEVVTTSDVSHDVIERGLERGWTVLREQLIEPRSLPRTDVHSALKNVHQWMKDKETLILPSDKNLGYVVVTAHWYTEGIKNFLKSDMFVEVSKIFTIQNLNQSRDILEELSTDYLDGESSLIEPSLSRQLCGFLSLNRPPAISLDVFDDTLDKYIPLMTGIPKLKNWKLRPIVPATTHGWIYGPAAKFVSKKLKPAVRRIPTIIESSKELAMKLLEITQPVKGKHYVFCTGDVESFYSNVPLKAINDIIDENLNGEEEPVKLIKRCSDLANNHLLVRYQGKYYLQTKGLAMGVCCSPEFANLYAAKSESTYPNMENVKFYKRYMDDILAILEVTSDEEVDDILSHFLYQNLTLKWSWSSSKVVFLDMVIWWDRVTQRIQFSPYAKPLNHYERIPFSSSHPSFMKKGVFVGELTRLAGLCSRIQDYRSSVESLCRIYLQRGYPLVLVQNWVDENCAKRWDTRYVYREEKLPPFIVKSYLNPVWEGVDWTSVFTALTQEWDLDSPPWSRKSKSLLLSRRKPLNASLQVIFRTWNKTILQLTDVPVETWEYEAKDESTIRRRLEF